VPAPVSWEARDGVALIALHDRSALGDAAEELEAIHEAVERAPNIGAALVYAATPGSFAASGVAPTPAAAWRKPLVVALDGVASAGGYALCCRADVLLATQRASFQLDVRGREDEVALELLASSFAQLPYRVAMTMALSGKPLSAPRAHEIGFVVELIGASGLLPAAERWATSIAEHHPAAARAVKEAALTGLGHDLESALRSNFPAVEAYAASAESKDALHALASGRPSRPRRR
jgi:enoyl-CoA hydratase/carnithine racemase